jgi:hypothetical protein
MAATTAAINQKGIPMKIEWWKLAKRGAMAAIMACCVVGLTGCDTDDDDDDDDDDIEVVGTWYITIGGSTQSIVLNTDTSISLPGDDYFISGSYTFTEDDDDDEYSITIFWSSGADEDDDDDLDSTWTTTCSGTVTDGYMYGTWSQIEDDGSTASGSWEASEA